MPRGPVVAACLALVSVLTGSAMFAVGCGDSGPSTTVGTTSSSAGGGSSSAVSSGSSGGGGQSSSSAGGSSASTTASSTTASSSSAGGSGGEASASSSAAASSSSASSSSSTGGGSGSLGDPCATSADCTMPPPNSALFYDKPGCGAGLGTCALKPTSQLGLSQTPAPVCGCDNVTYWNTDFATFHGVSVASQGACPGATAVFCDENTLCPGTMKCNRLVGDQSLCAPRAAGTCWSMPVSCPLGGTSARACSNMTCQSMCDLVQSQNPWWNDPTCP